MRAILLETAQVHARKPCDDRNDNELPVGALGLMNIELVTAIGLFFVYGATGALTTLTERVEPSPAIRLWSRALFCFAANEASAAASCVGGAHWLTRGLSWITLMAGGGCVLAGTFRLIGKPLTHVVGPAAIGGAAFLIVVPIWGVESFVTRLLVFGFIGGALYWAGILILRARGEPKFGRSVAAAAFLMAGTYSGSWPFLRSSVEIRALEFFLDLTTVLWLVAGVFLLHFERARAALKAQLQHELELSAKLDRAERVEAVGRLAGGVAHDFNNVLTTVIHGSELALRQVEDRPVAAEALRIVLESARGASKFTRQLLSLGRQRLPSNRAIDVHEAVQSARHIVESKIPGNVDARWSLPVDPVTVSSGEGQIEQVVVNLVTNAIEAMPNGGMLDVAVTLNVETRQLSLRVRDTGEGMSSSVMKRIFNPFFTTKTQLGGTGLGLAAVHAIVRQLGGRIDVQSELGRGSVFTVTLPMNLEFPAADIPNATASVSSNEDSARPSTVPS
ncbi:MAG: ATP-binding protein [Polyangiaceae bacterium]